MGLVARCFPMLSCHHLITLMDDKWWNYWFHMQSVIQKMIWYWCVLMVRTNCSMTDPACIRCCTPGTTLRPWRKTKTNTIYARLNQLRWSFYKPFPKIPIGNSSNGIFDAIQTASSLGNEWYATGSKSVSLRLVPDPVGRRRMALGAHNTWLLLSWNMVQ